MAPDLLGRPLFQLNKWMIFQQFARYVCQIHVIVGVVGTLAYHQIIARRRFSEIRHTVILGIHFVQLRFSSVFAQCHTTIYKCFLLRLFYFLYVFFFFASRALVTLRRINEFLNKLFVIQINQSKMLRTFVLTRKIKL